VDDLTARVEQLAKIQAMVRACSPALAQPRATDSVLGVRRAPASTAARPSGWAASRRPRRSSPPHARCGLLARCGHGPVRSHLLVAAAAGAQAVAQENKWSLDELVMEVFVEGATVPKTNVFGVTGASLACSRAHRARADERHLCAGLVLEGAKWNGTLAASNEVRLPPSRLLGVAAWLMDSAAWLRSRTRCRPSTSTSRSPPPR
jgi:hypothetical protein